MHHLLEQSTSKYPNKTAVTFNKKKYTFEDIAVKANKLANYLQNIGVKRGDRVVILLGNTIETVISFWSILKAGAVVVPIGTELKPSKIEYILKDSGAQILITTNDILSKNFELLKAQNLNKIIIPQCLEEFQNDWIQNFETVLINSDTKIAPTGAISVDLSAIIYTSGSTGEPKGVMLTHQNMIAATHSLNTYLGYNKHDKILCALPLSFDYGLYQMIMSISTGATLLLEKEFTWPIFLLKKMANEKATILPAVPTMVTLLHDQNKIKPFDLSSIRMVTNTGAALTRTNIKMAKELFINSEIFSMYGLTECKRCTYLPPKDIDEKIDSVGIAIPNTELWLVDDNNNKIINPNQVGQLVIRGATVMKGYWNKPLKTAEKLKKDIVTGDTVLYTGDYCVLDEDGYLYFKGRMDHVIKSRGIKVSPKEVEDFIDTIPEVNAVAVTGVPHKDYGEVLFAFVVLEKDKILNENTIIAICKNHLEAYKVPEYVSIISSMPKTPNGKFNIIALKEKALEEVKLTSNILIE